MINQAEAKGFKRYGKAILLAAITLIIALGIVSANVFADFSAQYDVEIIVDGVSSTVSTNQTQAVEVLEQANITVDDSDKLDVSGFNAGEGGVIILDKQHDVNIEFDKTINTYKVYADTVGDALGEIGLSVADMDKINYALTDTVVDGMVISIQTSKSVSITVDGETYKYALYQGTVQDLVKLAKIELGAEDYTEPALTDALEAGMEVTVYRVTYKEETVSEKVSYGTVKQDDDTMYKGTSKVYASGEYGEDEVTYKVKYVNGEAAGKTELSRKNITAPVDEIVYVGTKPYEGRADISSNGVESYNGISLGQVISGRYTHYCACAVCCGSNSGNTASGIHVQNGMDDPYYVACNWLPLGSVISVDGTIYTVVDRGGSGLSSVGRIDIYTPAGHAECYRLGTGGCTIEIVRLGW
ncbi:MAG: G5 domain-containing protein [Eubacterium sp.]|nr:G5 domain-containing protein [Eubacterium sp.]